MQIRIAMSPRTLPALVTYFLCLLSWLPGRGETESGEPRDPALRQVADSFWQWKLREFPGLGSPDGLNDHSDQLESYAYSSMARRVSFCRTLLTELEFVNQTSLTPSDRITYDVLEDQLRTYIAGYEWRDYGALNPLNDLEGIQSIYGGLGQGRFDTRLDFENYIRKLQTIPQQRGIIDELESVKESHFSFPFGYSLKLLSDESPTVIEDIRKRGMNAILSNVLPSITRLKEYLKSRYIPFTRPEVGVGSFDNGAEYYKHVLRWHISVNMTPEEVHEVGWREINRIRVEMETLMRWLNFDGDLKSFFKHLRTKPEFFDHNETTLLQKYRTIVHKRIQPRLPQLFANLSSIPNVTVMAMPSNELQAYYNGGVKAMVINTFNPHDKPDFAALTLCLHEALPGHHLQASFAMNQPLPNFRRATPYGKFYAAPFNFPIYTAYIEGWALYAEFLGEEMALFDDPYEFWSRDEAVEFLLNTTFLTRPQVEKEVDRYITWPGQACAYKIGELKIKELRARAITKLGWRYSAHEFHRHILELGAVPLSVLERHVDRWIQDNQPSIAHSKHMDNLNCIVVILVTFYRTLLMHFNLL